MRAAVAAQYEQVNDGAREAAERCQRGEFRNDPLLAMQCVAMGVTVGGGRDFAALNVKLTRFEKIACEKAQGQAGYVCDYIVGYGTNLQNNPMEGTTRRGEAAQGRFVKRSGRWVLLRG